MGLGDRTTDPILRRVPVPKTLIMDFVVFSSAKVWKCRYFFLYLQRTKEAAIMSTQAMTQQIAEYFKTQPVLKAWLFGSYARGEQREDSDVDILIIPDSGVGLFKLSGMSLDLQSLLQLPVDLVTEKGLMSFARPSVENDRILIYERVA